MMLQFTRYGVEAERYYLKEAITELESEYWDAYSMDEKWISREEDRRYDIIFAAIDEIWCLCDTTDNPVYCICERMLKIEDILKKTVGTGMRLYLHTQLEIFEEALDRTESLIELDEEE